MAKTKKETNIEVLIYGLNHIAKNHNTTAITENWEEEQQVCVMKNNVPTMSDIRMLCEDLGIPRNCIYETMFGIDIELPYEWVTKTSKETFKGYRFWERRN
jgi:catalase